MREFFYNGITRLDWGFENPNITGSLITLLMLAVWVLAWLPRGWGRAGFWLALLANGALGVCLVQTFSRGALVALLAGVAVLLWYAPRPWRKARLIAAALVAAGLAAYAFHIGFTDRTMHGLSGEDRSVTNRWLIYRVVPRMILDAPDGWGHERAAEAFRQWYQPVGRMETYGRLVSSHATWLVEWPWYLRLGYVVGWMTVFTLATPSFLRRPAAQMRNKQPAGGSTSPHPRPALAWLSVPLAVWLTFFIGSFFTAIAHRWQLWLAPGAMLVLALAARCWKWTWPSRSAWAFWGGSTMAAIACLWGAALLTPSSVALKNGMVTVTEGASAKETWLLPGIDETVLGQFYGHRLRTSCLQNSSNAWIRWDAGAALPGAASRVICVGRASKEMPMGDKTVLENASDLVFLNPDEPAPWLREELQTGLKATCKFGTFAAGSSRFVWEGLAGRNKSLKLEYIEGKGKYIGTIQ